MHETLRVQPTWRVDNVEGSRAGETCERGADKRIYQLYCQELKALPNVDAESALHRPGGFDREGR